MDPLSDVLSLLRPRNYLSVGFDAAGDWSVQFPGQAESIKCGTVVAGACWVIVEGVEKPVRLETGDSFLLPRGRPFSMASDLKLEPVDARDVFAPARAGGVVTWNGGGEFLLVSSRFLIGGGQAGMLLGLLPPIVHIRREDDSAALLWSMERMMQELRERKPGGFLVVEHLAHMVLVQALRLHLADASKGEVGWLFALADPQLSRAIGLMHADPGRRWTLQALAEAAGMSRSAFAARFRDRVGTPAIDYLTRWRMMLAADRLANSAEPIAGMALSLGYELESAFSTAFKREMGTSPRQYGRGRPPVPAGDPGAGPSASTAGRLPPTAEEGAVGRERKRVSA